ncbi:glycerophosphodiester phosphodiesterase [Cyclobacterium jeungdonense]|uniref:Glycerophosphodiester phosphodiesterase family protein n=1 Tax=Cyclobacterium jeungdonense TaxID=708087 RepID=A0ABT8CBR8_9BACT|nr:glycerophosphodiester phosphodiesterase family protein [Cyclobacterium jeungdonense]MDN3689837.1 glycerophosphodiester phosphodiesterase family protein [Cyclobacterium jeungdonense]
MIYSVKITIITAFLFVLSTVLLAAQVIVMPEKGFCAHRGAMATHPENTIPAFLEAIRVGAHMIELDVQYSKDSAMVLMHDATVDRTTNGSGAVEELTLSELRNLDAGSWKGSQFAGTQIPLLEEALEVMPRNIWLNIHLRGGKSLGSRVARLLKEKGRGHQAFLAVQDEARLGAQTASESVLICNMERQSGGADYVAGTVNMGADFIQLRGEVRPVFRKYARTLHEKGIRVNYFGTDDPAILEKLLDWGIDFPLVNDIAASMELASNYGLKPIKPVF